MNYIILNGRNSSSIGGLLIQSLPPISKPLMRTLVEEIDGRDGDIITKLGYSAYDKEITIGLYGEYDVDEVIAFFDTEGDVVFSNEPDKVYKYSVIDQIDFERLIRFKTATVTFHTQPYKTEYGEEPVDETPDVQTGSIIDLGQIDGLYPITSLVANIEASQNLNGYEYPWAGGTGKNLFNISTIIESTYLKSDGTTGYSSDWAISGYIAVTAGTTYTFNPNSTAGSSAKHCFYDSSKAFVSSIGSGGQTFIVESGIAYVRFSFRIGTSQASYDVQFEVGDTATSYVPYENYCPITGQTGKIIYLTGDNLFGGDALRDGIKTAIPASTDTPADRKISFKSNDSTDHEFTYNWLTDKFKENTQYTFIFKIYKNSGSSSNMRIYYVDGTYDTITGYYGTQTRTVATVSSSGKTIYSLTKTNGSGTSTVFYDASGIFEGELTVDDFKEYVGDKYPVDWDSEAGTVYGGTWNPLTGILTVTHARVNLGSLSYSDASLNSGYGYYTTLTGKQTGTGDPAKFICESYKYMHADTLTNIRANLQNGCCMSRNTNETVFFRNDNYADATSFKNSLNGVYAVYRLATPVTYELTEQTIETVNGKNTIWVDTDTITVTSPEIINLLNSGNTDAKPNITIYGTGNIGVYINGVQVFQIDMGDLASIAINAEEMNAYSGSSLANRHVIGDYKNCKLKVGSNIITVTGNVTEVVVSKFSRWI